MGKQYFMNIIANVLKSPALNMTGAFVLFATSGFEIFTAADELGEVFSGHNIKAAHGVFIYSIILILRVVPDVLEGAEYLNASSNNLRE